MHPLCKASDLWSASDSEQELELLELCKKRVVPVGVPAEELTWNDVLLPTQKARRQGYEELFEQRVQAGRAKHDDDWWCDLEQNHDGPRSKLHVDSSVHSQYKPLNTLITHQTLWHGTRQTVMCATDQARAHCWPVSKRERHAVGCIIDLEAELGSQRLTHVNLVCYVGDGWRMRPQGVFFFWLLGNVEVRSPTRLRRQFEPTPTKKRKHDDSEETSPEIAGSHRSMLTVSIPSDDDWDGE